MTSMTLEMLAERAARHAEAGDWDAARADWLAALALSPDSADVMLELSYVESLADHYRAARDWALRAARLAPHAADTQPALLRRLRTFNETAMLREQASRHLDDPRARHEVLMECGRLLTLSNDFDLALRCAQAAVAKAPNDPGARMLRGQSLADHGRIDEAARDFEWVLARNPRAAGVWWKLSRLRKQTPQSNHVSQLRTLLAVPGLRPLDAAAAARALHKELDELGDYAGAWQALQTMCKAMRSTLRYDLRETRNLVDALIAWSPASTEGPAPPSADRTPIFIVGMHRSGTTLLEQLLDASPQVRGIGEIFDFAGAMSFATDHHCRGAVDATIVERARGADFAEVGRRYLDGIAWRLDRETHFTDKLPANFLNIGFVLRALPQARILHSIRDPVETCFSSLRELFSDIYPYSYDQAELADYFAQYRRLMAHWHAAFPGRILDVDYARLTSATETTMREVASFCGLDYIDAMRSTSSSNRAVSTASAMQVRENVAAREVPKWAPYASYLQPMLETLRANGVQAG
jgi:Flp pilus assembly protein TadD